MYRSGTQVRKTRDERGAELGEMDYLRRVRGGKPAITRTVDEVRPYPVRRQVGHAEGREMGEVTTEDGGALDLMDFLLLP